MSEVKLQISSQEASGNPQSYATREEIALIKSKDVLAWFDARNISGEANAASRLTTWTSRKKTNGVRPTLAWAAEPTAPYTGAVPGGTRQEVRLGIDAGASGGVALSGSNWRTLVGSPDFVVPDDSFQIILKIRFAQVGSLTAIIATNDVATQMVFLATSAGALRGYPDNNTGLVASGNGVVAVSAAQNAYQDLCIKYDKPNKKISYFVNNAQVKAPTDFDLSPLFVSGVDRRLRLGSYVEGAALTSGQGFAIQHALLIRGLSDAAPALYRAMDAARPA